MNKWLLFFFFALFCGLTTESYAQKSISGVVLDEDKVPLFGVTVAVNGTTRATTTDLDGRYTISANEGEKLRFSYLGMADFIALVGKSQTLDVAMKSSDNKIEEIVVTAMGVKTEKKKLNFAVQTVNSDDLTSGKSTNFITALQGKVAGISVTSGGGSPNSGSQILLRGVASINSAQNNEPLIVLDGVYFGKGSAAAASINMEDIENVTVLKGAAASALYGMDAGSGVLMVTTKQGKDGKVTIKGSTSMQINRAVRLPETQKIFGPGVDGFYKSLSDGGYGGWGPVLEDGTQVYNNVKNYFKTGYYQKYDINASGGSEKFKGYASFTYSKDDGIIVNDYLNKTGLMLKGSFTPNKLMEINILTNITNDKYRGAGSTSSIYSWPINDDIRNYEKDGYPRYSYISASNIADIGVSPLFSRYKDYGLNEKQRTFMQGSISLYPLKHLEVTARFGLDKSDYTYDGYSVPRFNKDLLTQDDLSALANNLDLLGSYSYSKSNSETQTGNLLATYTLPLKKDVSLEFVAGAELRANKGLASSISGRNFIIPGIYSLSNVSEISGTDDVSVTHSEVRRGGAYGEARLDYKGIANLSVTSRWDWTSSILWAKMPIYYPSITGGLVFSELFNIKNDWFSFGKLRGNFAKVGKDVPSAYIYDRKYKQYPTLPDGGYGVDPSKSVGAVDLVPEIFSSWELGIDARFFNNKTRFDFAYYGTRSKNQILTVRVSPSSGYILQTRNEGDIKNYGYEATLSQDILKSRYFDWTAVVNFTQNKAKIVSLPEDVAEVTGIQYGDIYTSAYLGRPATGISGKDYQRTSDGKVIVGSDGLPLISSTKNNYLGNRMPDYLIGISNNFRYRNFTLDAMVNIQKGGDVVNVTGRGLWSSGMHKKLEFYRGRQVVWDGVVKQADGTYAPNTTAIVLSPSVISNYYNAVSSNFIEDASFVRLSYVTLGYDFTNKLSKNSNLKGLKLSLTGTNLLLLTKYTGADPQINASVTSGGTGSMGVDNYAVPNTMGFNLTISANF